MINPETQLFIGETHEGYRAKVRRRSHPLLTAPSKVVEIILDAAMATLG